MVSRKPSESGRPPRSSRVGGHAGRRAHKGLREGAGFDDPAREAALRVLVEVETTGAPAGGRVEQLENSLRSVQDRRLFRSLVTGTLRHRLRLDQTLQGCLTRGTLDPLSPWVRNALRLGAAQILLHDGIPPHAAVSTSVSLAREHAPRDTAGLVNAVLRRMVREGRSRWEALGRPGLAAGRSDDPAGLLSVRHSHPPWLVARWIARWGVERTERMLEWDNRIPDYWLRLAPGVSPEDVRAAGASPGWIPATVRMPAGSRPADLPGFQEGRFTIQDGSGILVGLLPPRVHGTVIDLCAAPGTKTGHLAERGAPGLRLLAMDRSPGRVRRMRRGLNRLAPGALAVTADGRQPPFRPPWHGVLIDAPCSNLGVLRRRVDLRWRASETEIQRLAEVQEALLAAAQRGVEPGGWLVYSVCTLEEEETLWQRDRFLEKHPEWEPGQLPAVVPEPARGREGEMVLVQGELETDGTYAFVLHRRHGGVASGQSSSGSF